MSADVGKWVHDSELKEVEQKEKGGSQVKQVRVVLTGEIELEMDTNWDETDTVRSNIAKTEEEAARQVTAALKDRFIKAEATGMVLLRSQFCKAE